MSAGAVVRAYELRRLLNDLSPLFPSGTHTIPVLFKLKQSDLVIACTTGCVYSNTLTVSNPDNESWEITVMYKNLLDFVVAEGQVRVEHAPYGVTLYGNGYSVQLPAGYSIISEPVMKDKDFKSVLSTGYVSGLSALVGMGLGNLYAVDKPVHMYGQVSVLKFPNVQVQARTPGIDVTAVIAPEHVRLLTRFGPDSWWTNGTDALIVRRDHAYLELPIDAVHEENTFVKLMDGLSSPISLDLEHYIDKLRSMAKMNARGRCKLAIKESGLVTTVSQDNLSITTTVGNDDGKVLNSVYLPMPLWMAMVKAAGNNKAEILFRGDVICLRTQAIIILARALA